MKKEHIEIPKPSSKFQEIICNECKETQIIYSHATTTVTCNSCGNTITESTGSKAKINGTISSNIQ